jgi:exopolysaccharide biosynthesis polyprenyl glycosylphosphotransferase
VASDGNVTTTAGGDGVEALAGAGRPALGAADEAARTHRTHRLAHHSHRDRDYALRRLLLVSDLVGLWVALAVALVVAGERADPLRDSLWLLPALPLWAVLFWMYSLYRRPIQRIEPAQVEDLASLFHALVVGSIGLWLYYKLIAPAQQLYFAEMLVFGLVALPLLAGLRAAMRLVNLRWKGPERVFAVVPPAVNQTLREKLRNHPEYGMALVGALHEDPDDEEPGDPPIPDIQELETRLASLRVDHMVVCLDPEYLSLEQAREFMYLCHREQIRFSFFTPERGLLLAGSQVGQIGGLPLLASNPPVLSRSARAAKRCMDIVGSALLLTLLMPAGLAIALAIKLDSKGPVLFRQVRVGRHGKRFHALKFRTMVEGADDMVEQLMSGSIDPDWLVLERDPRVTRLGRFLRRTSIDELPQLWNVLKGEMSLVGPRPLPVRDDERIRGKYRHRLDLTPGITGLWQVLGRNNIPFQDMLELDYAYVATWSLWLDIKILLRTVPVVLLRRGANYS